MGDDMTRYSHATVASDCDGPLTIVETQTRDAIKHGNRTIAYLQIGAEAWGPLLAAAPELRDALEGLLAEVDAMTKRVGWAGNGYRDAARAALAKAGV